MCKHPPKNFDDLIALELMQLATAGFDHLSHLKLSARPFAVCNARARLIRRSRSGASP